MTQHSISIIFIITIHIVSLHGLNFTDYDITCDNSTNSCTMSCDYNESCHDFDIISKDFLFENSNQYISNLTSLKIECNEENACHDIHIDCGALNVKNCTIGCLFDDACDRLNISCYGPQIEQCFVYTIKSDSAVKYSSIDCNYTGTSNQHSFCGYKCGLESDGCYEDNHCIQYTEYGIDCSCHGLPEACDEIFYDQRPIVKTTQFVTSFVTSSKNNGDGDGGFSIFDNLADEILVIIGIGIGIVMFILFILCYVCKLRIIDGKIQRVTHEYKIENKTLNSTLLQNDGLKKANWDKVDEENKGKNKSDGDKSNGDRLDSNISYDDHENVGSFKLIPDAELGDNLFNGVVIDDDDDY